MWWDIVRWNGIVTAVFSRRCLCGETLWDGMELWQLCSVDGVCVVRHCEMEWNCDSCLKEGTGYWWGVNIWGWWRRRGRKVKQPCIVFSRYFSYPCRHHYTSATFLHCDRRWRCIISCFCSFFNWNSGLRHCQKCNLKSSYPEHSAFVSFWTSVHFCVVRQEPVT